MSITIALLLLIAALVGYFAGAATEAYRHSQDLQRKAKNLHDLCHDVEGRGWHHSIPVGAAKPKRAKRKAAA